MGKKVSGQGAELANAQRRRFIGAGLGIGALALTGRWRRADAAPPAEGTRLIQLPHKRPLILRSRHPLQLETPLDLLNRQVFTPDDAFFVRWHTGAVPPRVDPDRFRLRVHGQVRNPLSLSLSDLKQNFDVIEFAAVAECAGNGRRWFRPRVRGTQWGDGAMGNATWRGVRLRDVLDQAGLNDAAAQVRFDGLDRPAQERTDYRKSLQLSTVRNADVLLAFAMNDKPLPRLNGYPLRLVVPGWYATYWVKMLNDVEVTDRRDTGHWMADAYRIPDDPCACTVPGHPAAHTAPLNRLMVRSLITSLHDGARIRGEHTYTVHGLAFDAGYGIERVLFSENGGRSWRQARLGEDTGRYSFRPWHVRFAPVPGKTYALMSMAINRLGQTQRLTPRWNAGGYLRNVIETVHVRAT
ncbi:MAG: molybdopterin-dependent oxidoreductase [Gammaproteobacteria bacterium]